MRKGQNSNKPAKGSSIIVGPITDLKDIRLIKKLLEGDPRNYCLFVTGINTNLRASDLVKITAGDVRHLSAGDDLVLREKKTGKPRRVTLNKAVVAAIQRLLASQPYEDKTPLFCSQRGGKALTVPSVNRLVKSWCRAINLRGNFGSHTLRKTFGFMQRTQRNTSIPELMVMFNHSTQRQTLDYLCIQPDEIRNAYLELEL